MTDRINKKKSHVKNEPLPQHCIPILNNGRRYNVVIYRFASRIASRIFEKTLV